MLSFSEFINESKLNEELVDEKIEFLEKYKEEAKDLKKFVFDTVDLCANNKNGFNNIPSEDTLCMPYVVKNKSSIIASKNLKLGEKPILISFIKCTNASNKGLHLSKCIDDGKVVNGSTISLAINNELIKSKGDIWTTLVHELGHSLDASREEKKNISHFNFQGETESETEKLERQLIELNNDPDKYDKFISRLNKTGMKYLERMRDIKSSDVKEEYKELVDSMIYTIAFMFYRLFNPTEKTAFITNGSLSKECNERAKNEISVFKNSLNNIEKYVLNDWDLAKNSPVYKRIIYFIAENIEKLNTKGVDFKDKTDKGKVKFFINKGRHYLDVVSKKIDKNFAHYSSDTDTIEEKTEETLEERLKKFKKKKAKDKEISERSQKVKEETDNLLKKVDELDASDKNFNRNVKIFFMQLYNLIRRKWKVKDGDKVKTKKLDDHKMEELYNAFFGKIKDGEVKEPSVSYDDFVNKCFENTFCMPFESFLDEGFSIKGGVTSLSNMKLGKDNEVRLKSIKKALGNLSKSLEALYDEEDKSAKSSGLKAILKYNSEEKIKELFSKKAEKKEDKKEEKREKSDEASIEKAQEEAQEAIKNSEKEKIKLELRGKEINARRLVANICNLLNGYVSDGKYIKLDENLYNEVCKKIKVKDDDTESVINYIKDNYAELDVDSDYVSDFAIKVNDAISKRFDKISKIKNETDKIKTSAITALFMKCLNGIKISEMNVEEVSEKALEFVKNLKAELSKKDTEIKTDVKKSDVKEDDVKKTIEKEKEASEALFNKKRALNTAFLEIHPLVNIISCFCGRGYVNDSDHKPYYFLTPYNENYLNEIVGKLRLPKITNDVEFDRIKWLSDVKNELEKKETNELNEFSSIAEKYYVNLFSLISTSLLYVKEQNLNDFINEVTKQNNIDDTINKIKEFEKDNCKFCGAKLKPNAKYCVKCGLKLKKDEFKNDTDPKEPSEKVENKFEEQKKENLEKVKAMQDDIRKKVMAEIEREK